MSLNFDTLVLGPCLATFGELNQSYPAPIYYPQFGGSFSINGIFDPSYEELRIKDGQAVTVKLPVLGCKQSDFSGHNFPLQGDQVKLRGMVYDVREVRDDGHSGITLMLNATTVPDANSL